MILYTGMEIDDTQLDDLAELCKRHHVDLQAGYYEQVLIGDVSDIETVTRMMWSMSQSDWTENGMNI